MASLPRTEIALFSALAICWGSAFPLLKLGLIAGASPTSLAAARQLLAAGILFSVAILRRQRLPLTILRSQASAFLGGSLLLMGMAFLFLFVGEETVPAGLAGVLSSTIPLWTAGLALFLTGSDRLGRLGTAGLVAGFVGVLLLFSQSTTGSAPPSALGMVFVTLSSLSFALGTVVLRRVGGQYNEASLALQMTVGGLFLLIGSAVYPHGWALPLNSRVLASVATQALLSSVAGYWLYFRLFEKWGPMRLNSVSYLTPVFGLLISWFLLGEIPTYETLVGLVIIIVAIFLVLRERSS